MLILGVIFVTIPYVVLSIQFDYPRILRKPIPEILMNFQKGGTNLIMIWWIFAISGIFILIAYNMLGSKLKDKIWYADSIILIGSISGILQIIGLMRWTFIVPLLAQSYTSDSSPYSKESIELLFLVIHQFGGVILGEHLGQLFTILWVFISSQALFQIGAITKFCKNFALISACIYLLAQLDLFKTIFPDLISVKFSGLIGSTMWLVWLTWLGSLFIKSKKVLL